MSLQSNLTDGVRAVIVDYGDVLCRRPATASFHALAHMLEMDPELFEERYPAVRLPYDQGALSPAEYWSKVQSPGVAIDEETLDALRRMDVEIYTDLEPAMLEWLASLQRAGFKAALLSNMPHDMAAHSRKHFDWLRDLDFCVLSCEINLIKPMREIYERCLEGLGVRPSEALFIDDREINTKAAEDAGIRAIQFASVERLRADLAASGFPILP